jgi:hypothetical protein
LLAMLYLKTYPTKHALAARRRGIWWSCPSFVG